MSIQATRIELSKAIDAFHEAEPQPAAVSMAPEELTEDEKTILDLKTIWPLIKSIFTIVRPFIKLFKGSKATILVDRFIAGIDIIIPAD